MFSLCKRKLMAAIFMLCLFIGGCGEKYTDEGRLLGRKIGLLLVKYNLCTDGGDCNRKQLVFGEHGDGVNFNFYGVSDSEFILGVFEEAVLHSRELGVPVTISFYSKRKADLLGFKGMLVSPEIRMEVSK